MRNGRPTPRLVLEICPAAQPALFFFRAGVVFLREAAFAAAPLRAAAAFFAGATRLPALLVRLAAGLPPGKGRFAAPLLWVAPVLRVAGALLVGVARFATLPFSFAAPCLAGADRFAAPLPLVAAIFFEGAGDFAAAGFRDGFGFFPEEAWSLRPVRAATACFTLRTNETLASSLGFTAPQGSAPAFALFGAAAARCWGRSPGVPGTCPDGAMGFGAPPPEGSAGLPLRFGASAATGLDWASWATGTDSGVLAGALAASGAGLLCGGAATRTNTRALCCAHQLPPIVASPQHRAGKLRSSTMKRHWPKPTSVIGTRLLATGVEAIRARELESCS